jgi:hypothetical protein
MLSYKFQFMLHFSFSSYWVVMNKNAEQKWEQADAVAALPFKD